jgi:exodeoxyribonuclease VII small subunit
MPRRKPSTEDPASPASFEDALAELESIIESMEHEQLPLEDLVACYEKGSTLLNHCEGILQGARSRIELITLRNQAGNEPATPQSTHTADEPGSDEDHGFDDATEESDEDPDDIRLF